MTQPSTPTRPRPPEAPPPEPWLDDLEEPPYGVEPEPEGPPAPAVRRLRRSRHDRVIAGVCGGLGEYLGIDPVLLRIALVVLTIGAGTGVLLYLIGWIAIPEETPDEVPAAARTPHRSTATLIVGGTLIAAGGILLLRQVMPWFDDRIIWPLVLIAAGLLIAFRGGRR